MSTFTAPRCARGASLGSLPQPSQGPGTSPAPGQLSWDWGQVWATPAVRPLLLWAPFFCCASFARRTSVLWCQLKVCQLSHAVAVVPYRVTCCYRENFGSITFPAVLPKLWLLIYPTPPHSSQIRDHPSSLCRIPSDFSAPLLSWLEGTGHKIRWTHPNPPCQAQELHPGAFVWLRGSALSS